MGVLNIAVLVLVTLLAVMSVQARGQHAGDSATLVAREFATGLSKAHATVTAAGVTGLTSGRGSAMAPSGVMTFARPASFVPAQLAGLRGQEIPPNNGEPFEDPGTTDTVVGVARNATKWLRSFSAILTVLALSYAGTLGMFAREPGDMDRARRAGVAAGVGFVVVLLAPQIVDVLRSLIGVKNG